MPVSPTRLVSCAAPTPKSVRDASPGGGSLNGCASFGGHSPQGVQGMQQANPQKIVLAPRIASPTSPTRLCSPHRVAHVPSSSYIGVPTGAYPQVAGASAVAAPAKNLAPTCNMQPVTVVQQTPARAHSASVGRPVGASPVIVCTGRGPHCQSPDQKPVCVLPGSMPLSPTTHPRGTEVPRLIQTLTQLLKDRDILKKAVVQCFKKVDGGTGCVNIGGLQQFRSMFSQVIQVPPEAFGDLVNSYICFDFDGNGSLEVNEVYKSVKFHLREYRKKLGFKDNSVDMPFMSLRAAGYQVIKELGHGSQGVVKLASNKRGQEVCVKCLEKSNMSASGIEELQEEFQTLQQLDCERIATVYELFQNETFYYMVGQPYHGGDFMTLKSRARAQGVTMSERWLRGVLRQCFEGIAFMHEQAIMHCDIKEPNIMLKTNDFEHPEVVLIDFGVSKAMAAKPNGMPGGTPGYMPPETWETHLWYPRGDIFSMGVTIIQVVTDKIAPTGPRTVATPGGIFVEGCLTIQDIMNATMTREPPFHLVPPKVPGLAKLLKAILSKKMQARPTAPQVLKDPWFDAEEVAPMAPRSKNPWATVGITKSFLARPSVAGGALPPAIAALQELQRSLDESHASLPAPATSPPGSPGKDHEASSASGPALPHPASLGRTAIRKPGSKSSQKRLVIVG